MGRGWEWYVQRVEMIVEIFNLKTRNELCKQNSTFLDLSLKLVCVPARLERLAMTIFLCALYTCCLTRATIRQHRIAFYFLPPTTCAGFMKPAESSGFGMRVGIVRGGGKVSWRTIGIVGLLSFLCGGELWGLKWV